MNAISVICLVADDYSTRLLAAALTSSRSSPSRQILGSVTGQLVKDPLLKLEHGYLSGMFSPVWRLTNEGGVVPVSFRSGTVTAESEYE